MFTTALTIPAGAFAQDAEPVADEALADEAIVDEAEEPEVSLPGGNTIIVTGRINRDPTRDSTQVISVLSSEQIARTGEGDIAGALGRVTGLSVQGQGFVQALPEQTHLEQGLYAFSYTVLTGAPHAAGADFVYMGTRFIPSAESLAPEAYKQMVVDSTVLVTATRSVFTSMRATLANSPQFGAAA